MVYRTRIFFTDKQKADIWDRWQRGEGVVRCVSISGSMRSHLRMSMANV